MKKNSFETTFAEYEEVISLARRFAGFNLDADCLASSSISESEEEDKEENNSSSKTTVDEAIELLGTDERSAAYKLKSVSIKVRNLLSGFFRGSVRHFAKEFARMDLDNDLAEKADQAISELTGFIPPFGTFVDLGEAQKAYSKVHAICEAIKAEQEARVVNKRRGPSALERIAMKEEEKAREAKKQEVERRARVNSFRARAMSLADLKAVVCSDRNVQ